MRLNTVQHFYRGWFVQEKFGALKLCLYYPNLVINFVVEAMTWSHVTQPNNNIYVSTSHPHNEIEIHACMFWNCCCKNSSTFNPYSSPAGTGNVFSTSLNNPQNIFIATYKLCISTNISSFAFYRKILAFNRYIPA